MMKILASLDLHMHLPIRGARDCGVFMEGCAVRHEDWYIFSLARDYYPPDKPTLSLNKLYSFFYE